MNFSSIRLPVSGINLGTAGTDVAIGSVTPDLADTSDDMLYVSDLSYPIGAMTYNQEGDVATYVDVFTNLSNATPFQPFGSTTTMDAGDALFIHPSLNTAATAYNRIYFNVTTAGVGTYTIRIQRYNGTSDAWENQTIATDTTNAFKTLGIGYIEFTPTVHGNTRLQQQDASREYWTKIELLSLTSATVARPRLMRSTLRLVRTVRISITPRQRGPLRSRRGLPSSLDRLTSLR